MSKKTSFKDHRGIKLSIGDLVTFLDPNGNDRNANFDFYRICRSIIDESVFLLRVHPYLEDKKPFKQQEGDRVIQKIYF